MSANLDPILDNLRAERDRIRGRLSSAQRTLGDLEFELARIESAIGALTGNRPASLLHRPRKRRIRAKGMTGPEVVNLMEKVLREDGPLSEPRLLTALQQRAKNAGRSRAGMHLVYKKMLRAGPFEYNDDQWRLRS